MVGIWTWNVAKEEFDHWSLESEIWTKSFSATSITYSPDGSQVALGMKSGGIRVLKVKNGTSECTLNGHKEAVNAVIFSNDGSQIASGSLDETERIWDTATGELRQTLENKRYIYDGSLSVYSLFSKEGISKEYAQSAVCVQDGWILKGGERVLRLPLQYRTEATAVHGNIVVVGCYSGYVLILRCY